MAAEAREAKSPAQTCVCYRCVRPCSAHKKCVLLIADRAADGMAAIHFKCPLERRQQRFAIGLDTKPFIEPLKTAR